MGQSPKGNDYGFPTVVLLYHHDEAATGLAGNLCGQLADGLDGPGLTIGKEGDCVFSFDEIKGHRKDLRNVGAIDTSDIPRFPTATSQHTTLAGITANEAGIIPCGRQF